MSPETIAILTEIATDMLANELARRARAKNMTTEELLAEAGTNWEKAEKDADELLRLDHKEK